MLPVLRSSFVFLVIALVAMASRADEIIAPPSPTLPPPVIGAPAYVLLDVTSSQFVLAQNPAEHREPASLTKLMTAYLVFVALREKTITGSQMVNVSRAAWKAEGSRMFVEPRKAVSVDELLRGLIVQSGNDAAIALAELVAGSEAAFADRMNAEAKRLGLVNTHFVNATGLEHPQHYSSAADISRLAAAVIRDFPEYYPLYSMKEYRYNNITQPNRNRLLWTDPYVDGMKTGHTDAAGWCLVAAAKRGQRRLLSVVLGASSDAARASESQKLLNYGFQAFDTVQLYQSGQAISSLRVWKGLRDIVPAGFFTDYYMTLPKGRADKLAVAMTAAEPLTAPVTKGQRVGMLRVSYEGKQVAEFPMVALEDVPLGNLFGRAWDTVRLWFK